MAGRPRRYKEQELIDKSIPVFWEKGYNGATAKDLMEALDIGQGSFYNIFKGGKKELYQKSLKRFWAITKKEIDEGVKTIGDPIDFIRTLYYSKLERSTQDIMNGCYFGNAVVEFRNVDKETRDLTSELMLFLEKELKQLIIEAQRLGKYDKEKSASVTAKYLLNLFNGFNITQRINPDVENLKKMLDENLKIFD
ncbi:TetR/AcrR family transcriptional regulator [Maribacter litoralis]|uniref:Transcriptional regulator, TetR family n=1 Tax=Maribacter litoralis TaxID=2059726 RepID=A0A653XD05_9FLAO|nr:TetR/AcrR family transcriptional regulator [Maribacter litoralis]VXC27937.1 Transcriptional regulator, TetR family [Maribacter litoralis]